MIDHTRRQTGAMTRAMLAAQQNAHQPRVLRVGVLQEGSILEERIVRERADVSAGTTERATLTVHASAFPAHCVLFCVKNDAWHLRFDTNAEGRVALGDTVRSLKEWSADPRAVRDGEGGAWLLALDDGSRGKVTVAGVTFLFQFVSAPPEAPRPQVPMALRRSLTRDMDWRYNSSLAAFLTLALGAMSWIEYGYDPVVDDNSDALEFVARRVRLSPPEDETPPEPEARTDEAAATPGPSTPSPRHDSPSPGRPNSNPHGQPSLPNATQVAQRAEDAAARAIRAMDANFGAITALATGPNTAVDQLQSQVLMAGTEADLRNLNGVSTRAPGAVSRPTLAASNNVPSGQHLGRPGLLASHDAPDTGHLTGPVGPHRTLVRAPEEPETDTCHGDASSVASVVRRNLGGVRACYERAMRDNPALHGRLEMRFTVGESGRVTSVSVRGVDADLDACVERAVQRMVFPVPACGAADYQFPVNVDPAG